jgi:hypothetical protein
MIEGFGQNIGVQGLSVSLGLRQLALKNVQTPNFLDATY